MSGCHNARHGDVPLTVLPLDCRRNLGLDHGPQILDADGLAGRSIDNDVLDVLRACTELPVVDDADVVLLAFLTVEGSHGTVHRGAESRCGRRGVKAVESQLCPVEIHLILRSVVVTAEDNLREVLVVQHLALNLSGHAVGLVEVVAVDLKPDGSGAADSSHALGDCTFLDFRILP